MKLFLTTVLALSLATATATANSDLEASLRSEADAISSILEWIDAAVASAARGSISADGAKAHRAAKEQYRQAKRLCKERRYEACYAKLRQAKKTVMPAVTEVMNGGVPRDVQLVVAKEVDAAAKRIAGVSAMLAPGAPAAAAAAYEQAEALYLEAKELFEKGNHKDAFAKLEPALDQLDIALRIVWKSRPAGRR